MTLDGQVLVIAFLALSLKLYLWGIEEDVVEAEDELHREDADNLDFSGCDFERERLQPALRALSVRLQIPKWLSDSHV